MIHYTDYALEEQHDFNDWDELKEQMLRDFAQDMHSIVNVLIGARKVGRWTGDIEAYLDIRICEK